MARDLSRDYGSRDLDENIFIHTSGVYKLEMSEIQKFQLTEKRTAFTYEVNVGGKDLLLIYSVSMYESGLEGEEPSLFADFEVVGQAQQEEVGLEEIYKSLSEEGDLVKLTANPLVKQDFDQAKLIVFGIKTDVLGYIDFRLTAEGSSRSIGENFDKYNSEYIDVNNLSDQQKEILKQVQETMEKERAVLAAVSYTHLTLPTKRIV